MELNKIDTSTQEGKWLMAAVAILTTSKSITLQGEIKDGTCITPMGMLDKINSLSEYMYEKAGVWGVDISWKILYDERDLGNVMKPQDCRFIGDSRKECEDFVTRHKPVL